MKKLVVIVGPTGTGKTSLGLELAKKFSGELISADSRQVFASMDVGTGKIEVGEENAKIEKGKGFWLVDQIPIHLYDVVHPDESYSVAIFQQAAYESIEQISQRRKLPILVGGTGLYIQAVVEGLKIPKAAPDLRLRERLEKKSTENLLANLKEVDPETFEKVDKNNRRRLVRALEVFSLTGEPISALKQKFKVDFDTLIIGLSTERGKLYESTDRRIESWFRTGAFQEEVKKLLEKYDQNLPSFTSLGYQDVVNLVLGKSRLEEAIQRTKFKHHKFIRAQLTWFRKMNGVNWFDSDSSKEEIVELVQTWLGK